MRILLLFSLLCFTATVEAAAQHTTPKKTAPPAAAAAAKLTPASLHTDKLNYADDLARIYVGDFPHVSFRPDSNEFGMVVGEYMTQYSESCARYLPANRVEIMTQECTHESWMVNGYGVEQLGSRHCDSWEARGTGQFADPQVYALQRKLDAGMAVGMIGDVLHSLQQQGGDPTSGMKKTTDVMIYVKDDMDHFLDENACAAAATMRFQANMLRFGGGQEPIRMPGGVEAVAAAAHAPLATSQNYERLVDDLIAEESSAWMLNRYSSGSVDVKAVRHDTSGAPMEIDARYGYMLMNRPGIGQVRVTFDDGAPQCLFFSDAPEACRAPSPKVVSAYKGNQYADAKAAAYPENVPPPPAPAPRPVPVIPGTNMTQSDVAAHQAVIRPLAPFNLAVVTVDPINENNATAGRTFRSTLQRPVILKDAVLQAGTTVYLTVQLDQRPSGTSGRFDFYNISVAGVETPGKTITVTSQPIRMTRRVVIRPAYLSRSPSRTPEDLSAIEAGTSMSFFCQEAPSQTTATPAASTK